MILPNRRMLSHWLAKLLRYGSFFDCVTGAIGSWCIWKSRGILPGLDVLRGKTEREKGRGNVNDP